MDDLTRKVDAARQSWDVERDDAWLDRQAHRFHARRRSRARWRQASLRTAAATSLALIIFAAVKISRGPTSPSPGPVPARAVAGFEPVRLPDGSIATPFDAFTMLRIREASDTLHVIQLVRGGARFKVVHKPERMFRVEAGPAVVEVLGTEFTVERTAERVRVSVLTGQVQIDSAGRISQLVEGETAMFPPAPAAVEPPVAAAASAPHHPSAPGTDARSRSGPWRALAAQGKLPEAYQALQHTGWTVGEDASDLLLAADVARLTHHPAQAVPPLRKMIDNHPTDPRVSAAAFTLGRVLVETGEFRPGAEAFAKARAFDQQGAISEDALAREVEAWSRAGDKTRAQRQAKVYLLKYPSGRRLSSVRQHGGLE